MQTALSSYHISQILAKKKKRIVNQSINCTATWTRQYVRFLVKRLAFNSTLIDAHSLSDKNALQNIYSRTNQGPNSKIVKGKYCPD